MRSYHPEQKIRKVFNMGAKKEIVVTEWSRSKTYYNGDHVLHKGLIFKATSTIKGALAPYPQYQEPLWPGEDNDVWQLIVIDNKVSLKFESR